MNTVLNEDRLMTLKQALKGYKKVIKRESGLLGRQEKLLKLREIAHLQSKISGMHKMYMILDDYFTIKEVQILCNALRVSKLDKSLHKVMKNYLSYLEEQTILNLSQLLDEGIKVINQDLKQNDYQVKTYYQVMNQLEYVLINLNKLDTYLYLNVNKIKQTGKQGVLKNVKILRNNLKQLLMLVSYYYVQGSTDTNKLKESMYKVLSNIKQLEVLMDN